MRARDWEDWVERWQGWAERELPGTRLGKRERSLLMHAATARRRSGEIKPALLAPSGDDGAEADLRAARKLEALRLVTVTDSVQANPLARLRGKRRFTRRRGVLLTPLGEALVATCRDQLENRKPLRWAKLMPQIKDQLAERRRSGS